MSNQLGYFLVMTVLALCILVVTAYSAIAIFAGDAEMAEALQVAADAMQPSLFLLPLQ